MKLFFLVCYIAGTGLLEAQEQSRDPLPSWFIPLREAVYEQKLTANEVALLYENARTAAKAVLSGADLNAALARCEYLMGRALQEEKRNEEAVACFERGIAYAEQSLAEGAVSEAYEMISGCFGQLCMLKPTVWVMANGLKVEQNAKKALALSPRNAAAAYFIASRWAFGPGILGDPRRGVKEMEAILRGSDLRKDDFFNVYSAIGYAHERLKQYGEARVWVLKSLEVYPTNKFARDLLAKIEQGK